MPNSHFDSLQYSLSSHNASRTSVTCSKCSYQILLCSPRPLEKWDSSKAHHVDKLMQAFMVEICACITLHHICIRCLVHVRCAIVIVVFLVHVVDVPTCSVFTRVHDAATREELSHCVDAYANLHMLVIYTCTCFIPMYGYGTHASWLLYGARAPSGSGLSCSIVMKFGVISLDCHEGNISLLVGIATRNREVLLFTHSELSRYGVGV